MMSLVLLHLAALLALPTLSLAFFNIETSKSRATSLANHVDRYSRLRLGLHEGHVCGR